MLESVDEAMTIAPIVHRVLINIGIYDLCITVRVYQIRSYRVTEAVIRGCSVKKVFLKFSQNLQKNPVPESILNKVADLRPATLFKKRLWHRCFPVNFAKFLRTPFLLNTSGGCFWNQSHLELDRAKQSQLKFNIKASFSKINYFFLRVHLIICHY